MKVMGFVRDTDSKKMGPIQYYRTFLPLREVAKADNDIGCAIMGKEEAARNPDVTGFDVYTMCRMYHISCEEFLDQIHAQGAPLVLDSDDDLTEDYKLVSGRGAEFKKVLGMVDYVTVSTPALADHFAQYTRLPPTVLRNCVDVDWLVETAARAKRLTGELTIGFIGSPTHWGDWRLPSIPLAHIVRDFDVRPVLCGNTIPRYLHHVGKEIIVLSQVPFMAYPVVLKQFDIVLCAVDSGDKFNAGKSALKALECMALGIIPICSRFQPYVELFEAGAPVVLVAEDSHEGWYAAMRTMILDTVMREQLSRVGPTWVREHRDMATTGYKPWDRFYHEIAN